MSSCGQIAGLDDAVSVALSFSGSLSARRQGNVRSPSGELLTFGATSSGHRQESDKACALLAYLAVEADRRRRREFLVGLLWPNSLEDNMTGFYRGSLFGSRITNGKRVPSIQSISASGLPRLSLSPHTSPSWAGSGQSRTNVPSWTA